MCTIGLMVNTPSDQNRGLWVSMSSIRKDPRSNFAHGIAVALVCVLLVTTACNSITGPKSEFAAANRAVNRWVQRHPNGWALNLGGDRALTRPEWAKPCAHNADSGFAVLRYASGGMEIDLFFPCPLDATSRVEDLAAAFSHVVLQELPHGITSRGWRFHVSTPSSSVSEKVPFSAPAPGRLLVTIQTPLYAVYGHSTRSSCQPPADAPSPEDCYLQREHRIPLSLNLAVPFHG